jgi:hypothetical protein
VVGNGHRRLGQAQSSTHIRHSSQYQIWHLSSSGTAARQEADCRTSTVTQAKAWNRWVLMPATCAATGICSIKPYLAQCAVLTTHHHGRCGVSASSALKRSKTSRGGVTAACRQASGTWESDHGLGSALSEFGYLQVPPSLPAASQSRPPSCLSRPSRHAVVSWEALARLPGSSLTRVFWTCPARESTAGLCSPHPPSGRSRAARAEPRRRVPREGPHEALIGRAAVPRGAAGGRTATAAVADHGRPEASHALSRIAPD